MSFIMNPGIIPDDRKPFGYIGWNGLNFKKSVTDRTSRLARTVRYVSQNGPQTRAELLMQVFGRKVTPEPKWPNRRTGNQCGSTWGCYLFIGAVTAGFLVKTRKGKTFVYSLGPNADKVSL